MKRDKIYEEQLTSFQKEAAELGQKMTKISAARVLVFVALVYFFGKWVGTTFQTASWGWSFLAMIPLFAVLVKIHQKYIDKKSIVDNLVELNEKEIALIKTGEPQFDGGDVYIDGNHDFSGDLDLFGTHGIFAWINRTATAIGHKQLADWFQKPFTEKKQILQQQKALEVLAPMLQFRQQFVAVGNTHEDELEDVVALESWAATPSQVTPNLFWKIIRWLMPIMSLGALGFYVQSGNHLPMLLCVLLNFGLLGLIAKYVGTEHRASGTRQEILKKYVALLALVERADFKESTLLSEHHKVAKDAAQAFEQLSSVLRYFDQRLNFLIGLGLNLFVLYDLQCMFALEKWKERYNTQLGAWLGTVATIDGLISLATYEYNNPDFCRPELQQDRELFVEAVALGHPLIAEEERICNDTMLGPEHRVFVVTGSNMAGKSTFLRAVALNVLLAQMGTIVCATRFKASIMDLMTSMRVQDSISKQTSYFQAELLRMQHIIRTLENKRPSFIILDEVLKGTNSEDKLLGSQLLVRNFMNFNCMAMIATHDLELGLMANELPNKVENLCFESIIEKGDLSFDYKLNRGIAKNKNATFLMRKMEIVPS